MNFWRTKQKRDPFYKQAKTDGYRARSAYKLIEIQDKYKIIKSNSVVIDLGCAPGGWLQVVQAHNPRLLVGIDLNPIAQLTGVHFGQFDIADTEKMKNFLSQIGYKGKFDIVLSDLSPNISGDRDSDHYESIELLELVYQFALNHLNQSGWMVSKMFEGPGTPAIIQEIKSRMSVKFFKPASSRSESREIYLICQYKNT